MNNYYVYIYCDPRNKNNIKYINIDMELIFCPFYVGCGTRNRHISHLKINKTDKNLLKINKIKNITKCGMTPIIIKIKENISSIDAKKLEQEVISEIGTIIKLPNIKRGPLTNMTPGGDGGATWCGRKMTSEHKEKIRRALSGIPQTKERKERQSISQRKRKIIISTEKRIKMVMGLKNMSMDAKNRISIACSNSIWINKEGKHKRVKKEILNTFLDNGWKQGFLNGGNHNK